MGEPDDQHPKELAGIGNSVGKMSACSENHELHLDLALAKGKSKVVSSGLCENHEIHLDLGLAKGKSKVNICGLIENHEIYLCLGLAKDKSEADNGFNSDLKNKSDLQLESALINRNEKNNRINLEQSSNGKDPDGLELVLSLSLPGSDKKKEPRDKQIYLSSPPQISDVSKEPNHGWITSTPKDDTSSQLICMSCRNCYIHIMVSEANPKCPKCCKREFLLDIYRGSPAKKTRFN